jgi:hypothetical protein
MDLPYRLQRHIRATVTWTPVADIPADPGETPYATHAGWVPLGEETLHVTRLNTGQEVVTHESLHALMNGPFGAWLGFLCEHPEWEDDVTFAPAGLDGIKPGELAARPAAIKAFVQWAVEQGLANHPERLPGLLEQMNYHTALEWQAMARRKPTLRLIRPRPDQK